MAEMDEQRFIALKVYLIIFVALSKGNSKNKLCS
jgi:hypothetical protein